jgi:hypothetical protein
VLFLQRAKKGRRMICQFCGDHIDVADLLHTLRCDGRQGAVEAAEPEECEPHPFNSRTRYEPGDDRDIWCKDCAYHRDHEIHRAKPEPERAPAPTTMITSPRDTSVQAFYNAVEAGIIRTRREQAYAALRAIGIATANEVFEYLKEQRHLGLRYDSNTRARFTELRDMGVIREVGSRPCRITQQTCITWEVVPSSEYIGPAVVHRCATCGQIVSREVPCTEESNAH